MKFLNFLNSVLYRQYVFFSKLDVFIFASRSIHASYETNLASDFILEMSKNFVSGLLAAGVRGKSSDVPL